MICERCKQRNATVHLTHVVNNNKSEIRVCDQCARELQQDFGASMQFNLHNLLGGLMFSDYGPSVKLQQEVKCERCGTGQSQFAKGGLLGCPQCYESFDDNLAPLIKRIQGTETHTGKVPKRTGGKVRINKEIRTLKAAMQRHINNEEFEKAAELRDKIRSLEEKLQ
ncbi:UvrB/UvrC motif-containing protein [Desulfofalx alkaliphila]|uniref:UvrB/UvrC motif-containing protein n=1 Tax=Desulfofalx alkaliphila TaxID=105483 RepID=UPI0004E21B32|nr:UvrB/UvrC motif-containing protein [Desulfofalx alkaliphila]